MFGLRLGYQALLDIFSSVNSDVLVNVPFLDDKESISFESFIVLPFEVRSIVDGCVSDLLYPWMISELHALVMRDSLADFIKVNVN